MPTRTWPPAHMASATNWNSKRPMPNADQIAPAGNKLRAYIKVSGEELKPYFTPVTKVHKPGPCNVPSAIKSRARWISPESKISNSGLTPASRITLAMMRTLRGVLITTSAPEFMVFKSNEQISGFKTRMCSTRFSGITKVEPAAATRGSSWLGTNRPPGPVVRLMMSSGLPRRTLSNTSR